MFFIDWDKYNKDLQNYINTSNSFAIEAFINELNLKNQTLQLKVDVLLEELATKNELIKFLKEYIGELVKENNMLKEENDYYKSLLFSIGEQIREVNYPRL
jgi:regulator of replication initiation timing